MAELRPIPPVSSVEEYGADDGLYRQMEWDKAVRKNLNLVTRNLAINDQIDGGLTIRKPPSPFPTLTVPQNAGSIAVWSRDSLAGADVVNYISNTFAGVTAGSGASLHLQAYGDGGDVFVSFELINSANHWCIGTDNSDSDKFKISKATSPGINDVLSITTAGNFNIVAPTSGIPLSVGAGIAGAVSISYSGAIGEGADKTLSSSGTTLILGQSTTWQAFVLRTADVTRISANSTGNVDIAAPASGIPLTINNGANVGLKLQGSGTSSNYIRFSNTSGDGAVGIDSSAGGVLFSGSPAYSLGVGTFTSTSLALGAGNIAWVILNSSGNITVNASSSGNTLNVSQIAGANAIVTSVSLSGGVAQWDLDNTSNTASSDSRIVIGTAGSSAGDPYIAYSISGVLAWYVGADNSDSDSFVWSTTSIGSGNKLKITSAGVLDITTGSGSLFIGGAKTRFESSEIACPTTSTTLAAAHGGPRIPDMVYAVWRCKTTEHGFAVGDEIMIKNDTGATNREIEIYADATNVSCRYIGVTLNPAIRSTADAVVALTAANWKAVLRCLWL